MLQYRDGVGLVALYYYNTTTSV